MKPIVIMFAIALATNGLEAQKSTFTHGQLKQGDLAANMRLLNLWGEKPEAVQRLYETAYELLASRPDATITDVADDAAIQKLFKENHLTHLGGPMLGAIGPTGARVWLRTCRPAKVEVCVSGERTEKTYGPIESTRESDLVAIVPVTDLKPGKRYPYRVLVDGKPITIPENAAIVTAPIDTEPSTVRIAFGTCFHRWGLGNQRQADLIRSREPAAMLLGGDIAVQDRNNHLGLHRADYLLRDLHPAWRCFVSAIPVYATWDDHDYFDNDKAGIPRGYTQADKEGVCDVFRQSWNNPSYGFGDERRGVFLRTRIGPCDVIMLDHRYFRSGQKGSFLGEEQLKWLESQLLDCRGPFIILSCGTMWSDYVSNGKDSWGRWDPDGRERIFQHIEKHQISGVLLISGDRHGARGFRIPRPSGFNFYEFEAGSLGGRHGPPVTKPDWKDYQLYGIAGEYALGEFSIDGTVADPQVTFRLIHEDGAILYELKLTRSQLTPPAK